jgi:PAS domain-containing protein
MILNRKLNSSPEFLELLLDNSTEGIAACDNDFNILFRNNQALKHHGIPLNTEAEQWHEFLTVMDSEGKFEVPQDKLPIARALKGEIVRDEYYLLKRKYLPDIS